MQESTGRAREPGRATVAAAWLAGTAVFLGIGTFWGVTSVERDLTTRSRAALAEAGIDAQVHFRGLDAVLTGTVPDARQAADAIGAVTGVSGTRHVASRLHTAPGGRQDGGTTGNGTAPTPSPSTTVELPPGRITFATGEATLNPADTEYLDRVATFLVDHPTVRLRVQGHSDDVGSDEVNWTLSQRRAKKVVGYLAATGVARNRLHAEAFAATVPLAPNDTAEGRATNRRVELVIEEPS